MYRRLRVELTDPQRNGHAADRYHGACEQLKKVSGEEYPEDAFSEKALAFARGTRSDAEWEDARAYRATLTAEDALVDARRPPPMPSETSSSASA